MPLHYRETDEDSHIWRIDAENDFRPSKRRRVVERFEKYGIECDSTENDDSSFYRSSMEEDVYASSSSLESSSETMELEDNDDSVETILQHYIRANSEIEFLKKGLDKLLALVGAKNENTASKQGYRAEMLNLGGHWMIANLLTSLTQETNNSETMDDHENTDHERVIARSCQILRELLLISPVDAGNNADAIVRYQVYCAGGLDAVVSALKHFPQSFEVQLAGCQFLSQLVSIRDNNDSTTTTLIKNLYQSTDRLNVIVRLVGCGACSFLDDLSTTQMWQLFFLVADIVRSVVRQSTFDSSEVIGTVEKYLVYNGDEDTMVIDDLKKPLGATRGVSGSGMGKYMYEHLMTILVDEEDCYETDVSSTFMDV